MNKVYELLISLKYIIFFIVWNLSDLMRNEFMFCDIIDFLKFFYICMFWIRDRGSFIRSD